MTIYDLKPRFQNLLRPLVARLAKAGVSANQVTLLACALSLALCVELMWSDLNPTKFLALPFWLLVRMGLNAIDGMLAREHGQKSALGGYLNELGDIVSDAATILPFIIPFPLIQPWIFTTIFLAGLSEYAGAIGPLVGASRRYDGPLGKSDRAALFGALGFWVGLSAPRPDWLSLIFPVACLLLIWTTYNRIARGVAEARHH